MKRKSSSAAWSGAIALAALACGGAVNANAAEKAKRTANADGGAAYGPWSGYGSGGYGTAAMGYAGPSYDYAGTTGNSATGGYGGGPCCNGVWEGYCAEKRQWCECRVKHRSRPLGRGAGPCCPSGCGQAACSPAAPVCRAAPCKRCFGLSHRCRKPCDASADGADPVVEDTAATVETDVPAGEPTLKLVPDAAN